MPSRLLSRVLMTVLALIVVVRTVRIYANVLEVEKQLKGRTFVSYFRPGLVSAVEWIKTHPHGSVYGRPHDDDRYFCERFSEMLYPIPFKPVPPDDVRDGDLLVLPVGVEPSPGWAPAFENGEIRVYRARR